MKRIVVFLLVSLLVFSFSACSEKAEEEEKIEQVQEAEEQDQQATSTEELSVELQKARTRAKEAGASTGEINEALQSLEIERGGNSGWVALAVIIAILAVAIAGYALKKVFDAADDAQDVQEQAERVEEEENNNGAGGAGTTALIFFFILSVSFFSHNVSAKKVSIEDTLQETRKMARLNGLTIEGQEKAGDDRDAQIKTALEEITNLKKQILGMKTESKRLDQLLVDLELSLGGFASKKFVKDEISLRAIELGGSAHKDLLADVCRAQGVNLSLVTMPPEGDPLCPAQELKVFLEELRGPKVIGWTAWRKARDIFSRLLEEAVSAQAQEPEAETGQVPVESTPESFEEPSVSISEDMASKAWVNSFLKKEKKERERLWLESDLGFMSDDKLVVFQAATLGDLERAGIMKRIKASDGKEGFIPIRALPLVVAEEAGIVKMEDDGSLTPIQIGSSSEIKIVKDAVDALSQEVKKVRATAERAEGLSTLNGQATAYHLFSEKEIEFFVWCKRLDEEKESLFTLRIGAPQLSVGKHCIHKKGYVDDKDIARFIEWFQKGLKKVGCSDPIEATDRLLSNFNYGVKPQ